MTTDTHPPVGAEDSGSVDSGRDFRPDPVDTGFGRRLRAIAGVREEILDWVPEERARYTRLGAIVLNTGLLAGGSLMAALGSVVPVFWVFLLPVALIWGYVILTVDGWLIASTHGVLTGKLKLFAVRLILSVLMGAFIAEPLVLWFFGPAIRTEIAQMRSDHAAAREAKWVRCNPPSGANPARCTGFLLNLSDSPASLQGELKQVKSERDELGKEIRTLGKQLDTKQDRARRECVGARGSDTTGRAGVGPNCRQDRREAAQFQATNRIDAKVAQYVKDNKTIVRLNAQLGWQGSRYRQEIKTEIGRRMAEWRRGLGRPGILDEADALSRLSAKSWFVTFEHWLLRLLLIVIDCLPVLTKMLSGTTAYDALCARQTEAGKRLHDAYLRFLERKDASRHELALKRVEYEHHARTERINEAYRTARARKATGGDDAVEKLAAHFRAQARREPGPGVG